MLGYKRQDLVVGAYDAHDKVLAFLPAKQSYNPTIIPLNHHTTKRNVKSFHSIADSYTVDV